MVLDNCPQCGHKYYIICSNCGHEWSEEDEKKKSDGREYEDYNWLK